MKHRCFSGQWNYSVILQRWTCVIHVSKTLERTAPKVNPNVKHRLWVMLVCQYKLTDHNKHTTWVQDSTVRRLCVQCEQGVYGKPLSSVQLCFEPKTALKKKKQTIFFKGGWNSNTHYNMDEPWKQYTKLNKPGTKGQYYMIPLTWRVESWKPHGQENTGFCSKFVWVFP